MSKPLVCICVPTYNAESTIKESLESILAQTYSNLIVHVSDNASTDDTLEVVRSINDPRLNVHPQKENIGGEGNFTRCIQMAEGQYTAIFHADDVYSPTMVEKQVDYLEANPHIGSVFTEAVTFSEQEREIGTIGKVPGSDGSIVCLDFPELFKLTLLHHNFLVCPSVLVRTYIYKEEIKEWGSSLFLSASDIDTWFRLAAVKPIAVLNERLMRYRISCMQFSDRIRNRTERMDFYLVMDSYLARKDVRDILTKDDLRHYGWLERHESVAIAINLCLLGKNNEVRELLKGLICWDSVYAGLVTKRGFLTLITSLLLYFFVFLRLPGVKWVARKIKSIRWK